MAKGFHQQFGFDSNETLSPMVKPLTIPFILTFSLTTKWELQPVDVNGTFLNGILQGDFYMTQPMGFESQDSSLVCKLHKALYGIK